MFTGLVEEIGTVKSIRRSNDSFKMIISANTVLQDVKPGDSISVNGVCLTVTQFDTTSFCIRLAPETRNRTNLGDAQPGIPVNLERSVMPTTRLGGHFVQGHIDDTGVIKDIQPDEDALWITIQTSPDLMRYIVTKGYITVDGTSLTVVDTGIDWFNITLISYSQTKVILPRKKIGDRVNLEVDILAKYIERLSLNQIPNGDITPSKPITKEFLSDNGFKA